METPGEDNEVEERDRLRRAAGGDASAWDELLRPHRDRLRRMIALRLDRRLNGRLDASDVLQEVAIGAIRALPAKSLNDLAAALRAGRPAGAVSVLAIQYAVPAISKAAAVEVSSLLALGLAAQHTALLLDALAAEQARHRDAAGDPGDADQVRPAGGLLSDRGALDPAPRRPLIAAHGPRRAISAGHHLCSR